MPNITIIPKALFTRLRLIMRGVPRGEALCDAIYKGDVGRVKILLYIGANVNYITRLGKLALVLAAEQGNVEILKLLLAHKRIDVNKSNCWYLVQPALITAVLGGYTEVVELLLAHKDINVNLVSDVDHPRTALILAAKKGDIEIIKLLLAHKDVVVTIRDDSGWTALMHAIFGNHIEIVKLLLAHKDTAVNLADRGGYTALMHAIFGNHTEIVKLLLAHKDTAVNLADRRGYTALMRAAASGLTEIVKLLLAHKDINIRLVNNDHETALTLGFEAYDVEMVKLFIMHKQMSVTRLTWQYFDYVINGASFLENVYGRYNSLDFELIMDKVFHRDRKEDLFRERGFKVCLWEAEKLFSRRCKMYLALLKEYKTSSNTELGMVPKAMHNLFDLARGWVRSAGGVKPSDNLQASNPNDIVLHNLPAEIKMHILSFNDGPIGKAAYDAAHRIFNMPKINLMAE